MFAMLTTHSSVSFVHLKELCVFKNGKKMVILNVIQLVFGKQRECYEEK